MSSESITDSETGKAQDLDPNTNKPIVCEIDTGEKLPGKTVEDPTLQDKKEGNLQVDTDRISNTKNEMENSGRSKSVGNSELNEEDGLFSKTGNTDVEEQSSHPYKSSVNDVNIEPSGSQCMVRCENVCESDDKVNNKIQEAKEGSFDKLKVDSLGSPKVELTDIITSSDKAKMNSNIKEADLNSIDRPKVDSMNKSNLDSVDMKEKVNVNSKCKTKVDSINVEMDCTVEDVEMRDTNYKASMYSNQVEKSSSEHSFSSEESDEFVVDCQSQSAEKDDLPNIEPDTLKSGEEIESDCGVFECSTYLQKQEKEDKSSNHNSSDQSMADQRISPSVVAETSTSSDSIIPTSSENIQTQLPSDQSDTSCQEVVAMETDECMGFGEMNLTAVQITPEEFENIANESDSICDSSISHCEIQNGGSKQPSETLPEGRSSHKSEKFTNSSNLHDGTTVNSVSNENIKNLASMITKIKKEPLDEGYYLKLNSDEKLKTTVIAQSDLVPSSSSVLIPQFQNISSSSSNVSAPKDIKASTTKPNNQAKKTPLRMISPKVTPKQFHIVHQVSSNIMTKAAPSNVTTKAGSLNTTTNAVPCAPKKSESFDVVHVTDILQRKHKVGNYKACPIPEDLRPYLKSYSLESCSECGDSFTSKDTLLMHEKRVSVTINYFCPNCVKNLTFYNKCTFLGHIRLHNKDKGQTRNPSIQVKADILSITLAPKKKLFRILQQGFSPMILASDLYRKSYYCTECYMEFENENLLSNHFGSSEVMCSFKYVCNMCNMCFPKPCSAEAHKRCHSKLPPYTCPECGIIINDHENFRDHIKNTCFHFSRSYLLQCKNGGDSSCGFAGTRLNTFLRHLQNEHVQKKDFTFKNETLKMEKTTVFHCTLCSFSSKHKQITLYHMQVHLKSIQRNSVFVFTCTECPQHFSSKQHLMTHNAENHSLHMQSKGVYPCSTCDTVTKSYSKYLAHQLQAHEMINAEFYICPDCKCLFEDPDSLESHRIACRPRGKQLTCKKFPPGFNNLKEHQVKPIVLDTALPENSDSQSLKKTKVSPVIRNIQPKPVNNMNVQPSFIITKTIDAENAMKKKLQSSNAKTHDQKSEKYLKIAPKQEPHQVPKVKSPVTHNIVLKIVKTTKHKCIFCPKEFSTKEEQEEHSKTEHGTFSCHLCGLTYDTQTSLNNHLKDTHEGKKLGYFCFPCKKKDILRKFSTSSALEKHLIFKHRISRARIQRLKVLGREESSSQSSQNESIKRKKDEDVTLSPVKRLRTECSGLYTCVKCNFSSEESDAFSAHIETHKTADASQCPECGLCFSVLPALKKHLFMVHKIRKADEYISEKGIKEPTEANLDDDEDEKGEEVTISPRKTPFTDIVPIKSVRKEGPIGELECRVCYREFESVSLLKNHMRVHGMAFIRSRRLVPEVKTESDKD